MGWEESRQDNPDCYNLCELWVVRVVEIWAGKEPLVCMLLKALEINLQTVWWCYVVWGIQFGDLTAVNWFGEYSSMTEKLTYFCGETITKCQRGEEFDGGHLLVPPIWILNPYSRLEWSLSIKLLPSSSIITTRLWIGHFHEQIALRKHWWQKLLSKSYQA